MGQFIKSMIISYFKGVKINKVEFVLLPKEPDEELIRPTKARKVVKINKK